MKILIAALFAAVTWAQTTSVDTIMSRVAENQAKALEQRQDWVYSEKQLLRLRRGNGKVAREEHREYTVTPGNKKFKKELTHFDGKYESKGSYVAYDHPGYTYK